MNNDLNISMKIVSSDNINMKVEDNKPIDVNMSGGIVEIDPIFTESPAYTITYSDINSWNHKSDFSGYYSDLIDKPSIPTKTSELVNDNGFIDKNVNNLANYTLSTNISEVGLTGNYSDLIDVPVIPTKTSDLDNDSNFITNTVNDLTNYTLSTDLSTVATSGSYNDLYNTPELANVATSGLYEDLINKPTLATVASTGDYDDLIDKPTIPTKTSELTNDSGFITNANIPTKTSDLTNDSGFITNTVNDLTNYTLASNLASVATSGSYNDLSNKPTIPTAETINIYANTENVIGTWLGKPLYRQIFEANNPTSGGYPFGTTTIEPSQVKKIDAVCYITQGGTLALGYNGFWIQLDASKKIYYTNSSYTGTKLVVIIEYTKSTD